MEAQGFPCGSAGKESACKKESACNVGRPGFDPWVGKIPWRREQLLTPILWPGEFHGLYSPWGRKELDRTERLSLHFTSLHFTSKKAHTCQRLNPIHPGSLQPRELVHFADHHSSGMQ